jgi:ABC-type branched-subunit amino acid transport system ATPase component
LSAEQAASAEHPAQARAQAEAEAWAAEHTASPERPVHGERIRAEGVTAGYGGDPVIRTVSVQVEPGQVVSLVGPNGSGKSTLLKSLVGIVHVSAGRVTVGDRDVTNLAPEEVARAGVGYVPQVDDVFAPLSVRENLEMGGYLLPKKEIGPRIEHVLTVFPRLATMLPRAAGKLSGGERKMLAMGRVLMLEPAVFLLDEPTANLAPAIATALLSEHVRRLAERGAAVLIVEQRAKAVLAISDRTYVLGGGQLRMEGTPAELAGSPAFVESFLGGTPGRAVASGEA